MKLTTHPLRFTTALALLAALPSSAAADPVEAAPAFEAMLKVDAHSHINAPASRLKKSCRGLKSNFLL